MTRRASAVIIGGGIWGSSTAYHLARAGDTDVLVLEQRRAVRGDDLPGRRVGGPDSGHPAHEAGGPVRHRLVHRFRAGDRRLVGLDITGCDVVEVYPAYDPAQITALVAANVAHEFPSLIALKKRRSA